MATIKEIAERAGVSTTTVSNVIHGKTKKVSPSNIQKIEQLIKELGYVQKMGLRVLNKEKSQLIAVVINSHKEFRDSVLGDPFYGRIVGYMEEQLQKRGYYLMLYPSKDIEKIFQMVMGWDVDGVIAISFSRRNCEKLYQLCKKPVVAVDAYGEMEEGQENHVINIGLDDVNGGFEMTKHLLRCGYEHIKVCAGRDNAVDHQRYVGAQQAAQRFASEKQKLQFVPVGMDYEKRKSSYEWLLQRQEPKTALFFLSDIYAMEAISYMAAKGVKIPEDMGVAGYDDIPYSELIVPKLTTVRQDVEQKAVLAVENLIEKIKSEEIPKGYEIRLPVTLMVRESTLEQ